MAELLILRVWRLEFDQQLTWDQMEQQEEVEVVVEEASYNSFVEVLVAYIEVVEQFVDVGP